MNWEAIGAIGEILGAVVVFVSVIYLALQVRQNTSASRAEPVRALLEKSTDLFLATSVSSSMTSAVARRRSGEEPEIGDDVAAEMNLLAVLNNYENGFLQHQFGNLPEELSDAYARRLRKSLTGEGDIEKVYSANRDRFTISFQHRVDSLLP